MSGAGQRQQLAGFGGNTVATTFVEPFASPDDAQNLLGLAGPRGVIPRGGGRAYGDAARNAGGVTAVAGGEPHISADTVEGSFTASASTTLAQVIAEIVPEGLFLPVTPGTARATIGGVIAADVHGKNHHRDGSIGAHVLRLALVSPIGEHLELTPRDPRFQATVGGMGLTGIITSATISAMPIKTSLMRVESRTGPDLAGTMAALQEMDERHRYSVAWLDLLARGRGLGRGVVLAGDHASLDEITGTNHGRDPLHRGTEHAIRVPIRPRWNLLSRSGVAAFNRAYYTMHHRKTGWSFEDISSFFHPLDAVQDWNLLYGPRGFIQYQFVVPDDSAGITALMRAIQAVRRSGYPGFLTVLKRFGPEGAALLSFPRSGWTLTIDLPCRHGLAALVRQLDDLVLSAGGRVYLAKDATATPEQVEAMYPRLTAWRNVQRSMDPGGTMQSDLSRRLRLTTPPRGPT